MAFLDDMRWKVEKGAFDVSVGGSSEDARLRGSYEVMSSAFIDGKARGLYAEAAVL